MIEASCHCGALRMEIATAPDTVTECACSICRKKGTLWAYYSPKDVRLIPAEGATQIYMWGDKMIEFHTCKTCGCTTHWAPADKTHDRMAVNARLMAPDVVAKAKLRKIAGP
ncbi:MAG: GFA family protein [Alphaproteobacteria bacterium]|jgi:hypothetical protein|nr:GFA family protein [Alphaproteobacteria bacterium]